MSLPSPSQTDQHFDVLSGPGYNPTQLLTRAANHLESIVNIRSKSIQGKLKEPSAGSTVKGRLPLYEPTYPFQLVDWVCLLFWMRCLGWFQRNTNRKPPIRAFPYGPTPFLHQCLQGRSRWNKPDLLNPQACPKPCIYTIKFLSLAQSIVSWDFGKLPLLDENHLTMAPISQYHEGRTIMCFR